MYRIIVLAAIALAFAGCSSTVPLASVWNDRTVKIDGDISEWTQGVYYNKKANALVGVRNDEQNIYVCFKTSDSDVIKQIRMTGLTLWLNNDGDDSKLFGIRFPEGFAGGMPGGGRSDAESMPDEEDAVNQSRTPQEVPVSRSDSRDQGEPSRMPRIDPSLIGIKFVDEDGDPIEKMSVSEGAKRYGIIAKVNESRDAFVYEIAVPLKGKSDFMVQLTKQVIGLGLTAGDAKIPLGGGRPPQDMGEGGPGGGMPGGGMPGGGMPGGRPGGMGAPGMPPSSIEKMEIWFEVNLSGQRK